jgi:two-component system phosphate regulon sensor histidine kinase PhoR
MNYQDWRSAFNRLALCVGFAGLVGWSIGYTGWAIALTLLVVLGWQWLQLYKMQQWLLNQDTTEPPESSGIWGSVFDDIYHLQRRQKKSQDRLKAVLMRIQDGTAALKDGVLMANGQGNLEWWNHAATQLLGLKENQDVGQPITNLVRAPEFKHYFERANYDEPFEMASPANHETHLQFHITLFSQQDRLIICRDISRMKQLEAMRQDFVANASHELSTPLTVISGYLETFLDHQESLPNRWGRALKQMHQQSLRMQSLIHDLLTLSRLENGQAKDHSKVNVKSMLAALQEDAITLSADKNQSIELTAEDIEMIGIDSELSSAFSNLIFNAVKYTQAQGTIYVKWWGDENGLHLSIKDNGIGIDSPHIPRLTERFYRADPSRHSETGGTGLGLAIVKHILLRHDGHLEVQSVLGKGSNFTCHFPISRKAEPDRLLA